MSPKLLPDDDRPPLFTDVVVDGEEVAVWRVGNQAAKAHKPDPDAAEDGDAEPACDYGSRPWGNDDPRYKFETIDVTREWRDPCSECWPDHYVDAGEPNDQTLPAEDDGETIDARRLRYKILGDD